MGGPGSGNYFHSHRPPRKRTVEECLDLDANRWTREGILTPGLLTSGTWRWTYDDGRACSIGYLVDTRDPASPTLRLSYSRGDLSSPESYAVGLTTTVPAFGPPRWWFRCPVPAEGVPCGRRVGKLYLPPGGRYFGCRACLNLTYRTCQEGHEDKSLARLLSSRVDGLDYREALLALRRLGRRGQTECVGQRRMVPGHSGRPHLLASALVYSNCLPLTHLLS